MMSQTIVNYQINIPQPNTHYANVKMEISGFKGKTLFIKMPVWTPGSYMIREFERNVIKTYAKSGNDFINVSKTDKNTWKIDVPKNSKSIIFEYVVYCFEAGIRTTYIDTDRAFILPTSCLMFLEPTLNQKGKLELQYPSQWKTISTTLKKTGEHLYEYDNYDDLADSPIEIGNHEELKFDVKGVPHRVAMVGINNCPKEQFIKDLKKICETAYNVFGSHPSKEYLFIIHNVEEGGGGLEHANSNVVQMNRFSYSSPSKYVSFLGLCAHEYFHLWNVKRLRPKALGPFDYNKENYTNLLWVAEGITSYYDELLLLRAGFWNETEYLNALSSSINNTLNRQGAYNQSLHEASFDAWIKEYRPNENSVNTQISYYLKGAVLAAYLDIEIIKASSGKRNLDDLMKYLYQEFYEKKQTGFTDEEFYNTVNIVAGQPIDLKKWVNLPNDENTMNEFSKAFQALECQFEDLGNKNNKYTGFTTETKGEKTLIKTVDMNSPAQIAGLQFGDEIIAINDLRVKNNVQELIGLNQNSNSYTMIISRNGIIKTITFETEIDVNFNIKLSIKNKNSLNEKWLKVN